MPELSFKETATAAAIAAELRAMGLEVQTGIGKTGLTATLQGAADGPTLMVRADIDGLPLDEATGLAFASKNGAMHACGHDGHIAIALGTARALVAMRDRYEVAWYSYSSRPKRWRRGRSPCWRTVFLTMASRIA